MSLRKKVHIFGSTGLIGSALLDTLRMENKNWEISQPLFSKHFKHAMPKNLNIATIDHSSLLEENDIFVFAIGKPPTQMNNPESKIYIEVELKLLNEILNRGKKVIYFSTNRVVQFLEQGLHSIPAEMISYVEHKLEVEKHFSSSPYCSIFRLGKVIHSEFSYFKKWEAELREKRKLWASSEVQTEPIHIRDVIAAVIKALEENFHGILEFWAIDSINYYEIASLFLSILYPNINTEKMLYDSKIKVPGVERPPNRNDLALLERNDLYSHAAVLRALSETKERGSKIPK